MEPAGGGSGSWSTQQLSEFIAAISGASDEASAIRGAVDLAAGAVEAEVGALLDGQEVRASIGFPRGRPPDAATLRAAAESGVLEVPGAGVSRCIAVPVSGAGYDLVVARSGEEEFSREEAILLRAMGRSLAQTLGLLRSVAEERELRQRSERQTEANYQLVEMLRERQTLLERLFRIQRSISLRAPLEEVFDAIAAGAKELLGDEVVGLRLIDEGSPDHTVMVACAGIDEADYEQVRRERLSVGVGGRAITEDRLVVVEDYLSAPDTVGYFTGHQLQAAMAAPVHENGRATGSLAVASYRPGRTYSKAEQDILLAFAEHASLALSDAKTVQKMQHQAFHDPLTGLPNRALFLDRLSGSLRRARREVGSHLAVLFIDLDRFKVVNDSLGHAAGDELLVEVGTRLQGCIREIDTAARLGGDEFAVLVDDPRDTGEAVLLVERLLERLRPPFHIGGKAVSVGAAVGVAMATGREEASELLRNADLAMYRAKAAGGGRYAVFEPGMHAEVLHRLDLEGELRRAVAEGEFVLHYQPVIDLVTGAATGAEALVRWNHPERGLVMPADFIPVAEETGLIVPLGRWVLEEAARQATGWQHLVGRGRRFEISVNLSARQLQGPDLPGQVAASLKSSGLDPECLTLELTETSLMQDTEGTIEQLHGLKKLGIRLAIDDFGTGYSSLGYLKRFPIDALKIDRSFVTGIGRGSEESALAGAIITLAETLRLVTVAEGIEEVGQLAELRRLNCRRGQGYLFSKPMPPADLEDFIRAGAARPERVSRRTA
ncbi:MAG TPA: EAL domain-containing protein [Candidatus Dormibacteraeota bacterium]|jgi:diguanylate cyclase (GGDEF)-like protein|nr:EAL domain-containing protein [Candidatus Dormibacteraeota bacterium]